MADFRAGIEESYANSRRRSAERVLAETYTPGGLLNEARAASQEAETAPPSEPQGKTKAPPAPAPSPASDDENPQDKTDKAIGALLSGMGKAAAVGGAAYVGYNIMSSLADASHTTGSIAQQLIAGGGGGQSDNAVPNAIVGALNRLAGLRSRL
jgi:hypothetical protein